MSDATTLSQGFLTLVYFHDNYRTSSTNIFFFCKHTLRPILPVYRTFSSPVNDALYIIHKRRTTSSNIIHDGEGARLRTQSDTKRVLPEDHRHGLDARNNRFLTATDSSYLRFALRRRESLSKRELEVMLPLVYSRYRIR